MDMIEAIAYLALLVGVPAFVISAWFQGKPKAQR